MVFNQYPDLEFRIFLFGDQILSSEIWIRNVDRDYLLSRCALISYQVEDCTVVPDASCRKNTVRIQNRPNPLDGKNKHFITGVKIVDDLCPFQILTDLVLLKVCDPYEVSLRE